MAGNEKLDAVRAQVDAIDTEMIRMFSRRMELADQVAEIKRQNNLPIVDRAREAQVIEQTIQAVPQSLRGEAVTFMRGLMAMSKSRQRLKLFGTAEEYAFPAPRAPYEKDVAVAFCGEGNGRGEEAARQLFSGAALYAQDSFAAVFQFTAGKEACAYGVVPIEDRRKGAIGQVYDLLRQYGCYIVGQTWVEETRYIVIADTPEYDESSDVVSVSFRTAHRSGALVDALFPFMSENVNMKRLESRPVAEGKYCFFCDLEGNIMDPAIADALRGAAAGCGYLEVLGCYRENSPVRQVEGLE